MTLEEWGNWGSIIGAIASVFIGVVALFIATQQTRLQRIGQSYQEIRDLYFLALRVAGDVYGDMPNINTIGELDSKAYLAQFVLDEKDIKFLREELGARASTYYWSSAEPPKDEEETKRRRDQTIETRKWLREIFKTKEIDHRFQRYLSPKPQGSFFEKFAAAKEHRIS